MDIIGDFGDVRTRPPLPVAVTRSRGAARPPRFASPVPVAAAPQQQPPPP